MPPFEPLDTLRGFPSSGTKYIHWHPSARPEIPSARDTSDLLDGIGAEKRAVPTHRPASCHLLGAELSNPSGLLRGVPSDHLPLVLLVEPLLQRLEVLDDRGRVHLALAGDGFEGVGPG